MTLYAPVGGRRQTNAKHNVGTSYETVVPAPETLWTLESLVAANVTGSAAKLTVEIYDSNAAAIVAVVVPATSIPANTPYQLSNHHVTLERGQILRVKSDAATSFDVTAVGIQGMPSH